MIRQQIKVNTYKDLLVWQKAMELVKEIYRLTDLFPPDELYGLRSQMQRAVVSIPSQIAEGYMRKHKKEYIQFLAISLGSAAELETQIIVCKSIPKFDHLDFSRAADLLDEELRMLYSLINKLTD